MYLSDTWEFSRFCENGLFIMVSDVMKIENLQTFIFTCGFDIMLEFIIRMETNTESFKVLFIKKYSVNITT